MKTTLAKRGRGGQLLKASHFSRPLANISVDLLLSKGTFPCAGESHQKPLDDKNLDPFPMKVCSNFYPKN